MSAHTPGPWKFALFEHEPNEAFVQWRAGFAAVHGSRAGREANARLIAAAPYLLAELRNVCEWLEAAEDQGLLGDKPKAAISAARAVIAAAEGKT